MRERGRINDMNIRTVLFDLDGTLIDTNELIMASFKHTFAKFQLSFTDEEISTFNGPPLEETFYNIDPERADEMLKVYRKHNIKHHRHYVKVFPQVIETLKKLKQKGIKLAIVTSKMRKSALIGIEETGLLPFFPVIITCDDVDHPKPHPEPVLKALNHLNRQAKSAIMVGDNYHDIVSGQRANVLTAGVAWSSKGESFLQAYHPTYMLKEMKDLLRIIES